MKISLIISPALNGCDLPTPDEAHWLGVPRTSGSGLVLSNNTVQQLARAWVEAWNTRNLKRLAEMYADDCELSSPLVTITMGEPSGRLRGKRRLIEFWELLFARKEGLACELFTVYRGIRVLTISYRFFLGKNALEHLEFGDTGHIVRSTSTFDQVT
jgi:hypothetical protein